MKTELEKFIEWLEGYNDFCYDNSKDLVFDTFGENVWCLPKGGFRTTHFELYTNDNRKHKH